MHTVNIQQSISPLRGPGENKQTLHREAWEAFKQWQISSLVFLHAVSVWGTKQNKKTEFAKSSNDKSVCLSFPNTFYWLMRWMRYIDQTFLKRHINLNITIIVIYLFIYASRGSCECCRQFSNCLFFFLFCFSLQYLKMKYSVVKSQRKSKRGTKRWKAS